MPVGKGITLIIVFFNVLRPIYASRC